MYDPRIVLEQELGKDEQLLWSAQPKQGVLISKPDHFSILFGIIWTAFAVFWEYQVLQQGTAGIMILFGIPFIVYGCYMTVGKFFLEAKKRVKTFYGITNKRIIILHGLFSKQSNFFDLAHLEDIILQEEQEYGTILLILKGSLNTSPPKNHKQISRLEKIDNAQSTYNLIKKLISKNQS